MALPDDEPEITHDWSHDMDETCEGCGVLECHECKHVEDCHGCEDCEGDDDSE